MNDHELMTAMRESFTAVHSDTPVERIVSRSRAIRARRRIPGAAAAVAVAAAAAVTATTVIPGGHRASQPVRAQLAAWTVVKQADGSVAVTIRELRDPGALQSKLRADGVPASVIRPGQLNPCEPYPHGAPGLILRMVTVNTQPGGTVFDVHPSAFPKGAGVQFSATFAPGLGLTSTQPGSHPTWHRHGLRTAMASPVAASQQCTGSG